LNKKSFSDVFQSYFHSKYLVDDFLDTKLLEDINFKINNFQTYSFVSYIKNKNNQLTTESKKLKDYHTFLNNILFKYMDVHQCVFSYKENTSIYDAISLHKNNKNYFKTDIKRFFHSINSDLILHCLKNNIDNYPILKDVESHFNNIIDLIVYDDSLPVGFVTSPSISNVVLYEFDNLIEQYCTSNHIIYTRYSDDLIFSANEYQILKKLPDIIVSNLQNLYGNKFELNVEKTQFLDKTNKLQLLGLTITPDGHITVEKHIKENMRQLLYFYMNNKDKFKKLLDEKYDSKLSKAYGGLNYINDVDKNFILKLRKKYGNYIVDKFLHGDKSK
jgi:RNA-directed DNA polymerase